MNSIKLAILNQRNYVTYSAELLQRLKNPDERQLAQDLILTANELFESSAPLIQKFLILSVINASQQLLKEAVLQKSQKVLNYIAGSGELLNYFRRTAEFDPENSDRKDPYRGMLLFPNDDPQLSIKYFNTILLLIQHLGQTYPLDKNKNPTKFKSLYDDLQQNIGFPNSTDELYEKVSAEEEQQQQIQQPRQEDDPMIQIEVTDNIELVYDMLSGQADEQYVIEMLQSYDFQQYSQKLSNLQREGEQRQQIELILEYCELYVQQIRNYNMRKNRRAFLELQHKLCSLAAKILNKTYQPNNEFMQQIQEARHDSQLMLETKASALPQQSQFQRNDQPVRRLQQTTNYDPQNDQTQLQRQQEQDRLREQQRQEQLRQEEMKQREQYLQDQEDIRQENIQREEQRRQQQLRLQEQEQKEKERTQAQLRMKEKYEQQEKQQFQTDTQQDSFKEMNRSKVSQANSQSGRPTFEKLYNSQSPITQPISQQLAPPNFPNSMKMTFGSSMEESMKKTQISDHAVQDLLIKLGYSDQQIQNWKQACLFREGTLFENDVIRISVIHSLTTASLNKVDYLQMRIFFTNKTNITQQIQVSYQGDSSLQFWIKNQVTVLKKDAIQQLIAGYSKQPIIGVCQFMGGTYRFVLPVICYTFLHFKDVSENIFNAKSRNMEFYAIEKGCRISREGFKVLQYCELGGGYFGAVYDNELFRVSKTRMECTNENMLQNIAYLFF